MYDGWITTSKVVDSMKKSKQGLIFKFDFEKVYNHVCWGFTWFAMRKIGIDNC